MTGWFFIGVKIMNVTVESSGSVVIAYLIGEIDHHTAAQVRESIDNAIMSKKPTHLIIDFRNVTFMDSSGIGLVMGRYRNLKKTGSELCITETSEQIYRVMKLAGIERLAKLEGR